MTFALGDIISAQDKKIQPHLVPLQADPLKDQKIMLFNTHDSEDLLFSMD